jgi:hypothetical protein
MGTIMSFLTHYEERLRSDGFITTDARGREFLDDNLMGAFARLRFKTMAGFEYDDVKKYVESCKKPS